MVGRKVVGNTAKWKIVYTIFDEPIKNVIVSSCGSVVIYVVLPWAPYSEDKER